MDREVPLKSIVLKSIIIYFWERSVFTQKLVRPKLQQPDRFQRACINHMRKTPTSIEAKVPARQSYAAVISVSPYALLGGIFQLYIARDESWITTQAIFIGVLLKVKNQYKTNTWIPALCVETWKLPGTYRKTHESTTQMKIDLYWQSFSLMKLATILVKRYEKMLEGHSI